MLSVTDRVEPMSLVLSAFRHTRSKKGRKVLRLVLPGNYCDLRQLEHVKCRDLDHLSSFVSTGFLFLKMCRRTELKCSVFDGGFFFTGCLHPKGDWESV